MNRKEQKELREVAMAFLSMPDIKCERRTPSPRELEEKYKLKINDKSFKMDVESK